MVPKRVTAWWYRGGKSFRKTAPPVSSISHAVNRLLVVTIGTGTGPGRQWCQDPTAGHGAAGIAAER